MLDMQAARLRQRLLTPQPVRNYGAINDAPDLNVANQNQGIPAINVLQPNVLQPQLQPQPLLQPQPQAVPQQQQGPSYWTRFKNWIGSLFSREEATSFVTANTPGLYTGPIGSGVDATSFASALGRGNQTAVNQSGATFSGLTMGTDVLGLIGSVSEARSGHRLANDPTATSLERYEGRSQRKRGIADTTVMGSDLLLAQGGNVASSSMNALGVAGDAAKGLGGVAAAGGLVVNAAVAARSGWRGFRALMHAWRGRRVQSEQQGPVSGPVAGAVAYHQTQMGKRAGRHLLGAAGAAAGAVAGGLALAGLLATPVGWGLLAAGGLVAAGIGAHKLYRWWKKRKEGTLHTERRNHAAALVDAVHGNNDADRQMAENLLGTSFGPEYLTHVRQANDPLKRQAVIDSVARKIHGW